MIGAMCDSLIQGMVRSTRFFSPPEQKRIGASPSTSRAPFSTVDLPAISCGPQVGQVAHVLVLPDDQRVEAGLAAGALRLLDALPAQLADVEPALRSPR